MDISNDVTSGETLAEEQGMTQEIGRAIAQIAGDELGAGRMDAAQRILEGLVATNPHDPANWTLLALVEKRRGRMLAARVCAGVAYRLAPADRQVRLTRAEVLLAVPDERIGTRRELEALVGGDDPVAVRSRALLTALGPSPHATG
jgi:cytochrome c-type biogenesis protein CcmH/NrfG